METKMFRQGEIVFIQRERVEGSKRKSNIIREGEQTGHMHEIVDGQLYEKDGVMYLKAEANTTLIHPEHKTLNFPKGSYEIRIQREYDPIQDRYVMD